jgi:hypothetical protein
MTTAITTPSKKNNKKTREQHHRHQKTDQHQSRTSPALSMQQKREKENHPAHEVPSLAEAFGGP